MTSDRTQRQSPDELDQARELSLQRAAPPTHVPGYDPRRFLGSGAYGEVWVAVDHNTGRQVAIKFYTHRTRIDWALLSREVEKLVFLSADRYVVQLLDVGWDAEPPYYVMEYMERGSLAQYLQRRGSLPIGEAVEIFRDVATGLLHAHGKGVLHCDLKPANILLDQDYKPRLADFGQSRLSHEQTPALGTLFYMAPEQADLEAVPDARWDVYGLGALLYCMLTGTPPHRDQVDTGQLDSAATLTKRLSDYRARIQALPPVDGHRKVAQIDRALIELIDRCLAVDPRQRFPNVQSVLNALQQRDHQRDRQPLLVLGFLGPLLLVTIMTILWLAGISTVPAGFPTDVDATGPGGQPVCGEVCGRSRRPAHRPVFFGRWSKSATAPTFKTLLREFLSAPEAARLLADLPPAHTSQPADPVIIAQLIDHPQRLRLETYLEQLLATPSDLKVASWFVVGADGAQLAAAYASATVASQVGNNFAYRTYFHGGPEDLARDELTQPLTRIANTHLSAAFQSTATDRWKVAVSTPIYDRTNGQLLGFCALTVDLGSVIDLAPTSSNLFTVLVDGRQGENYGVILEHPLFKDLLQADVAIPSQFPGPVPRAVERLASGWHGEL